MPRSCQKKGHTGGRPPLAQRQKNLIIKLFEAGERDTDIAKEYGIGRSTVYKVVNEAGEK